MNRNAKLVYTSAPEEAKRIRQETVTVPTRDLEPQKHDLRVTLDRKRRGGKSVTVVSGFQLTESSLESLGTQLKKRCGSGGTARGGEIEIQGDHIATLLSELQRLGYRAKRSGG